uniref:Uncharacterized protein n=1 Tax=Arundo donax TaxID=35708 RepID=A0A0A9A2H1_ARUDO
MKNPYVLRCLSKFLFIIFKSSYEHRWGRDRIWIAKSSRCPNQPNGMTKYL